MLEYPCTQEGYSCPFSGNWILSYDTAAPENPYYRPVSFKKPNRLGLGLGLGLHPEKIYGQSRFIDNGRQNSIRNLCGDASHHRPRRCQKKAKHCLQGVRCFRNRQRYGLSFSGGRCEASYMFRSSVTFRIPSSGIQSPLKRSNHRLQNLKK